MSRASSSSITSNGAIFARAVSSQKPISARVDVAASSRSASSVRSTGSTMRLARARAQRAGAAVWMRFLETAASFSSTSMSAILYVGACVFALRSAISRIVS